MFFFKEPIEPLAVYNEARELHRQGTGFKNKQAAAHNEGNRRLEKEMHRQKMRYYRKALRKYGWAINRLIAQQRGRNCLDALYGRAMLLCDMGLFEPGVRSFQCIINDAGEDGFADLVSMTKHELGRAYRNWKKYEEAETWLVAAIEEYKKIQDQYGIALSKMELAVVAFLRGNLERSRALCASVEQYLEENPDPSLKHEMERFRDSHLVEKKA